jgi:uncharacterized protein DUF4411
VNETPAAAAPGTFVLDSNTFIEAKQRYYAFDVCPGFWQALVWQYGQGKVVSIDRVRNELTDFDDELKTWALTTMPDGCFFDTDMDPLLDAYREAIAWVMAQVQFTDAAKAEFADTDNADAWVIAFAKAMDATVVTHEKPNPNVKRRVPIPNVCNALGVPYVDTFQMLRALETQFFWQQP